MPPPPLRDTPQPKPPRSNGFLSILDGFVNSDNPLVSGLSRIAIPGGDLTLDVTEKAWDLGGVGLNTALGRSATPLSAGPAALNSAARGAPVRQADLDQYTARAAAQSPAGASGPVAPIMYGMYAAEKAWDYGVNRPIGTAALVTTPDSPLYNGKPIRAIDPVTGQVTVSRNTPGFQLTDVNAAWNRTATVSAGQALAANPIASRVPMISGVTGLIGQLGGADRYDPWDDNQMSAAQNNPFYVFATGGTDLALQLVVPPMVRAGRIAGMRKVGLTNTVKSADELAQFRADFDAHTPESPTAWGTLVDDVTNQSSPAKIRNHSVVANNVGADKGRLSDILAETTDRSTVNEILLANMGDVDAIRNLAAAAPDIVWRLSEADLIIQSNAVNGVRFRPTGPELGRVNQVFDSALERNRYFGVLRDELTVGSSVDEAGNFVPGVLRVNSTWRPTNSIVVEKVRKAGRDIGYAAKSGDWSDAPQWVSQRFDGGKGSPVTSRVQWAGSRSPLGHVSNSGARPDEKYAEFNAQMDSIPFMRGNRLVTYEGRQVPAYEWREKTWQWLNSHDDPSTPDAWMQMETRLIDMAADAYGVERSVAQEIGNAYRRTIGDAMTYLRESDGYLFDEFDGRIVVDPVTMRQMLSSFQTLPMADVLRAIKDEGGNLTKAAQGGQDIVTSAYDTVQKVFRTDVLFRPGYTGKNSIIEPWISSFLAHGTIIADEGLHAVWGNFTANGVRRFKRVAYTAQVHKLIDSTLRTRKLKAQAKELLAERYQVQTTIDNALSEMDSWNMPGQSPATRALYEDEVRSILVNAQLRLDSIDKALDGSLPEWRQVVEPATQAEVRAKLREFRAIVGDDPEYVDVLVSQAARVEQVARARVQSPREMVQDRIGALERQLNALRGNEEYLSENYTDVNDYTGHSVARDGGQRAGDTAGIAGNASRGRDYQGVANRRQIESLEAQLEEARGELAAASDEAVVRYTPNEQAELDRVNGILDRIDAYNDPVRRDYPGMNRYGGESMGGVGPDRTYTGMVDTSVLAGMHGNVTIPGNLAKMGEFDAAKMTDPVVVLVDPQTGWAYVGEGNHRVALAASSGVDKLPVRVVRARISDEDAAKWNLEKAPITGGPAANLTKLDLPASPWKDGLGKEYWPPEMHPSFIGLSAEDAMSGGVRAQIEELQALYDELVTSKQSFEPKEHLTALQELQDRAALLDEQIGVVSTDLIRREGRNERIGAELGSAGYAGSGSGTMTIYIGGERFEVPAAFSTREYMHGEGYRVEASAQRTNEVTFDPGQQSDYETGRWRRSNGPDVLTPDSPLYWTQMAHVGNRYLRSDPLVQKYLSGWSRERIAIWLATPEGKSYQTRMGKDYLQRIESYDRLSTQQVLPDDELAPTGGPEITDIRGRTRSAGRAEPQAPTPRGGLSEPMTGRDGATGRRPTAVLSSSTTELDTVLRLVDQYFPDKEVQKRLADGEVTAGELKEMMGGRTDLSRIAGDDLNYHPERRERVRNAVTKAADKLWHWIATMPEDRIARWPFYQREFRNQITARATVLQQQGVRLSDEQWGALRQASHRGALRELEKTFYNIRRYNTPVYNSRFVMTFPGAFFNSIYRYGRFLVREPERMMQLGMLGADIIKWGAVDEEGNRVDDVRDAKYFLVPGTKSESSSGVKLPLTSLATLTVNYPSFGIGILMAASIAQRVEVKTAESLKAAMGETLYGEMFPYGISNNPLSNIAGAYQKDIWRAAWGTADTDFNRSVMSLYGYQMYEWEKNGEQGEQPTLDDAIDDIAAYYSSNAAKKFVSPFSIQTPIEGDLMAEAWSEFEQKYEGDTQAAREAFTAKYGDAARWLTMPTSMRTAYVPPTMAAQERVWEQFPDVAKRLVAIDPANPEYVSLLAYGTGGTYSSEVSKFMQTNPLPGDDTTLVENMDPTEFDSRAQQSLGWDAYSAGKTKYDAEHLRLVTLRDEATSEFEKQHYRDKINGLDQEWSDWVTSLEESNKPWAKQKGGSGEETADIATLYLNEILAEPDLAKLEEFQKVAAFLKQREIAKTAYAAAGDDEKKALKSQFTDYVRVNFAENDPDFTSLWDRYYASEWDIANGG